MELEKQKFPWLNAMEFELNHRVTHYLMTEHEAYLEYRRLREEIGALERKYFYLAGQADMMPYMHTLQRVSKEKVEEDRYKIDHLQLESWQMEIINHAVEEAEQEARKNCKEYGEIEKKISELYSKYPFIDSFTDNSKMKEGRSFSSEELQRVSGCFKKWRKNMRKKILKVKCPRHILFGDPSYLRVELREKPMEGYPDIMLHSMVIYLALKQTIGVYMDGKMFESQEVVQKDIGVDTAEYVINVDGRYENIHTGGDGYWGGCDEFYHKEGKQKICDAVMIAIAIPDSETFEGMEQLANYFFEDAHEVGRKEKAHRKEETAR